MFDGVERSCWGDRGVQAPVVGRRPSRRTAIIGYFRGCACIDFDLDDPLAAFAARFELTGAANGPLAGLSFAAKDLYDVAGHVTGAGNPDWARTHAPSVRHASAVEKLLAAGATLVGKTHTDELSRGIYGENAHYGTPINPRAPDRVPGGSSSGSAAAVAGGLCDVALGTDTGGSVRAPASFCGLVGVRPTHARIPIDGVVAQAPSYDTVGWFARDVATFDRVARVLLPGYREPAALPRRLVIATDALALAEPAVRAAMRTPIAQLRARFAFAEERRVSSEPLADWLFQQSQLQGYEAWHTFADWIDRENPRFGFEVADAFIRNRAVDEAARETAARFRVARQAEVFAWLDANVVVCFATAPFPAPKRGLPRTQAWQSRQPLVALMCIAGTLGAPQLTLPVATVDGAPVGLSLLGAPGTDEALLAIARGLRS
jgi:amidase